MEIYQHTFNSNIRSHDNNRVPFDTSDMWANNISNTPTIKQTDTINDLVSLSLLNTTPTDQTLSSLDPQSGWYEPLESIISSSATSIEGAPRYTTNTDKIDNHCLLQSPLLDATANLNNDSFYGQPNIEEPILLPTQEHNTNEIKVKKKSLSPFTFKNMTERSNRISGSSPSGSKNCKTAGVKKQRKKLTDHQKIAHNKIEKRYRININTKIAKLQQIIPWVASNDTGFEVSHAMNASRSNSVDVKGAGKVNKSKILDKAVDYIQFLQDNEQIFLIELNKLKAENDELKAVLAFHQGDAQRYSS